MIKLGLQYFGGRGAKSGGAGGAGGAGGGNGTGGLDLPDGSKIEFDGELKYGEKDAALSADVRTAIENWESKRVKAKVEYAYSVDKDGNPVGPEVRGGKGSVRTPLKYHETEDATFTHIHPREDGGLGGTFSDADLINFSNAKNRTTRAAAKEGTYSISKTSNFNKSGFNSFLRSNDFNAPMGEYRKAARALGNDYRSGKIDRQSYLKANAKAFNTALVSVHNVLLDNQSKYGYTYTLESR